MDLSLVASVVTSIGTGLIGFLAGKKRSDKEIEQLSLANVEQALGIYKDMLDDMKLRYDQEIDSLKKKLSEYQSHIASLEDKIKVLSSRKQSK
jgi:predicted RNase H-like nuclease (RuvC/YqgF family)